MLAQFLPWFVSFMGLLTAWLTIRTFLHSRKIAGWPIAAGKTLERGAEKKGGKNGRIGYLPAIKYQYTVAGQTYTGDRINARGVSWFRTEQSALDFLDRWRDPLRVYYDPKRPASAYLDATPISVWLTGCLSVTSLAFLLIGAMAVMQAMR